MERLPIRSVNLGTGENGMHPEFKAILGYLRTQPIKLTITSNGHSVAVLEDKELLAFHDIEFSLDYPAQAEQDAQRGNGNWELIHHQAERCVRLGVPVTITAVMMKANYLRLARCARVAKDFDAPLRVNVYQAVRSDIYALSMKSIGRDSVLCLRRPTLSLLASRWCERWRASRRSGEDVASAQ